MFRSAATVEKSRGRIEKRILTTSELSVSNGGWPGLNRFVRLERTTTIDDETTTTVSYAVTSLSSQQAGAATLLKMWRGRWDIENRLFWIRDTVLREDHSRIRTGTAPQSMSILKNAAINYLRALKVPNVAAALRKNAVKVQPLLHRLGLRTF